MTITELKKTMIVAMKEGNKSKRSAIQQWIQNVELAKTSGFSDTEEDLVEKSLLKTIKKLQANIEEYKKIGREDFVQSESEQLSSIIDYAPKKLSAEEIEIEVKDFVTENDFKTFAEAMKNCAAHFKGRTDNKIISAILKTIF